MKSNFINQLDKFSLNSKELINENNTMELEIIDKLINNTYLLLNKHLFLFTNIYGYDINSKLTLTAIVKNLTSVYSSLELLKKGFYGSSRTILRQVFEYLIISKFNSLSNHNNISENWEDGNTIYFGNEVLKNINIPDTKNIKDFWILLCKYSHSTIYSQQVEFDYSKIKEEIDLSFVFILILLDCNYHLFNSILLDNKSKNFIRRYDENKIIYDLKQEIKNDLKDAIKFYGKGTKNLLKDYKSKWKIKN